MKKYQKFLDTQLALAVQSGDRSLVQKALAAGGRVGPTIAINNIDLLTYAVFMHRSDILEDLLKSGADPNVNLKPLGHFFTLGHLFTPLIAAARQGNPGAACCAVLLRYGADTTATDRSANDALKIAAQNGYDQVCSVLVDAGMDPYAHGDGIAGSRESAAERAERAGQVIPVFEALRDLETLHNITGAAAPQDVGSSEKTIGRKRTI